MKSICLGLTIMLSMAGFAGAVAPSQVPDALTVIHARKSVRHFTGEAVEKAALETIVKAGMAAPTAVNQQPWSFVIVTDKTQMAALADDPHYAKNLTNAGAAIIVCTNPDKSFNKGTEIAVIDASLASENILLAIEALGLGGVWTAAYPDEKSTAYLRKVLGIPQDIIPLNVIPVGHPTGKDKPKDKFKKEKIHWERW